MRRRRRRAAAYAAGILAALIVSLGYIFQLKYVEVSGSIHNSAQDVSDVVCTDWTLGNTLLTCIFNRDRKIRGEGFISSVNVTITKIHSIKVDVTEKRLVGCVLDNDTYWYFDSSGRVEAEAGKLTPDDKITYAEGLQLETDAVYGEKLPVSSLVPIEIMTAIRDSIDSSLPQPDKAVFADDKTVSLVYGSVTVLLGDGTDISLRLEKLADIISILTGGDYSGTLHLENYDGTQTGIIFDKNSGT